MLVADDEGALRRFIVRALSRASFEVVEAADGLQAARLVKTGPFDVIVSDVLMPGMDGFELLRVVRERDLDLPVFLTSGTPSADPAAEALRLGVAGYIVKPFELTLLESEIRRAIDLRRLARERRRVHQPA